MRGSLGQQTTGQVTFNTNHAASEQHKFAMLCLQTEQAKVASAPIAKCSPSKQKLPVRLLPSAVQSLAVC